MQSLETVKKQIKFQLFDLSSQNGHFVFEQICRHFSRQRVGANILPATGPVAAGGDQGRDFETFRVFLRELGDTNSSFYVGAVPSRTLAFACTIQRESLVSKAKADIKSIVEQGTPVDGIYFFSLHDVPVSERNKLKRWALETHQVHLDLIDGEGLAEQLADKELFWIAEEYLKIPSEVFPPVEDVDYQKSKVKWKGFDPEYQNYSEFDDLKWAARGALFNDVIRHDLLFWIGKLESYSRIEGDLALQRKAAYEAICVRMRGAHTLAGREDFVRRFFSLGEFSNPVEAEDALVVLTFAEAATRMGAAAFTQKELLAWRKRIESYVDGRLETESAVAARAVLYEIKGNLKLSNPEGDTLDEGVDWWLKLTTLVENSPMFPLERFAALVTLLVPVVGDHPQFDGLTTRVDDLLSRRVGGFAAAEKNRDRSIAFYDAGKLIKAIKELHKAKHHWFAEERLGGSLLAMILLTEWYEELGLTFAAKHYGMAVSFMAARARDEDAKSFFPRGLTKVAYAEYLQGNWATFFYRAEMVVRGMGVFSPRIEDDPTTFKMFQDLLFCTGNIAGLSKVLTPSLTEFVRERASSWNIPEWTDDIVRLGEDAWSSKPSVRAVEVLEEALQGSPWSDVGEERVVEWRALGISWCVRWRNRFAETSKAEHFLSSLQMMFAELAEEELYLLPVRAYVDVAIENSEKPRMEPQHTNQEYRWKVYFPARIPEGLDETNRFQAGVLGVAYAFLSQISLLSDGELSQSLEAAFRDGLASKTLTVNSYEVMYRDLTSADWFGEMAAMTRPRLQLDSKQGEHEALKWRGELISQYNKESSEERIRKRYDRLSDILRFTLPRLREDETFMHVVGDLRERGWKDWHILMAVGSVVMNFRAQAGGAQSSEAVAKAIADQLDGKEEIGAIPVPLGELSSGNLHLYLFFTMLPTLQQLGLHLRSSAPSLEGIWKFLGERCNYWSDDIEHQDPFA